MWVAEARKAKQGKKAGMKSGRPRNDESRDSGKLKQVKKAGLES